MLPTRQVFSSKELEELKNAFSRIIPDTNNKVDWSSLDSIKQTITTYKSLVPKQLDKIDNESTLLQLEKEVEKYEQQISDAEEKKSRLELQMADPEVYSNGEKAKSIQKQIDQIDAELEKLNSLWEEAAAKII